MFFFVIWLDFKNYFVIQCVHLNIFYNMFVLQLTTQMALVLSPSKVIVANFSKKKKATPLIVVLITNIQPKLLGA